MDSSLLRSSSLGIDPPPLRFGVPTRLRHGVRSEEEKEIVRKKIQLREKIDRKVWLKEYSRKDILELFNKS